MFCIASARALAVCSVFVGVLLSAVALAQVSDTAGDGPTSASESESESGGTIINVKNADISALIRIFSEKTKRNFILDERVKGKVSLYLPKEISADESLKILDSVLALKGFTSVPVSDNLWKVIPSKEAIQATVPTVTDDPLDPSTATAAVITRIVHLKHISADDAKQILTPLISASGLINAYTGTNSLIIVDSEDNIVRVMELVNSLDVASRGRELTIIPIEYADAVDVATKLQEILGESEAPQAAGDDARTSAINSIRARIRESRSLASGGAQGGTLLTGEELSTSSTTVSARTLAPKIIPDERTNSVIVVADDETTARIRGLISQLDSDTNKSGFRFYVYRCKHTSADELANVFGNLSEQGGTGGGGLNNNNLDNSNPLGLNRNSRERGGQFASTQNRLQGQSRTPGRSRSENNPAQQGGTSVMLGDNLSITSDPATNSLIIFSDKDGYEKILALLAEIDIKPRQVLVEAVLLEVRLDDRQIEAFEWQASGGGKDGGIFGQSSFTGNLARLVSDPAALSNFTLAAASSGTITVGDLTIPSQAVLLNAAANNSMVNVLSSPNILATDNQQAEIVVGQNVPFLASTATNQQDLNNTFNTIDRQDVGITLRLTPQIFSDDTVKLNLFTEVSNVQESSADSQLGPTTSIRTSETTAIAKSGQMIVIGGLMSDEVTDNDTGVPYLMDIPVLGYLFKSSNQRTFRTNLLIFITARIIRDQFDHRDTSVSKRDEFKEGMERINAHPGRDEQLYSHEIDQVTKAEKFKGTPPTTIRGRRSVEIHDVPSAKMSDSESASVEGLSGSVNPKFLVVETDIPLPESEGVRTSSRASKSAEHLKTGTSSSPSEASLKTEGYSGEQYVLFSLESQPDKSFSPPFPIGSHVAVKIPATAAHLQKQISAGKVFQYGPKDQGLTLKVEGAFHNIEEASEFSKNSGGGSSDSGTPASWYTLSPFEIMNFGKGPWHAK